MSSAYCCWQRSDSSCPPPFFFIAYYFALPLLVGYAPAFMSERVWGPVNLAYLFALSQFFMAWIIAGLYVVAAKKFDMYGRHIMEHLRSEGWFHVDENGGAK